MSAGTTAPGRGPAEPPATGGTPAGPPASGGGSVGLPAAGSSDAAIAAAARRIAEAGAGPPRPAPDPVNVPMIRHWLTALGDRNPRYLADGLAPPAMTQVWTMRRLGQQPDRGDPLAAMSALLDEAGFTSVVATNCEQTYHRYLRVGEQLTVRSRLVDVVGPKRTALGPGWFVTTESTWYAGAEPVAVMLFRVLKFQPGAPKPPPPPPLRPVVSRDTAFFWAGTAAGELRVQRCGACGALRHPPGPGCPECGGDRPGHLVAAGVGRVYSYVVHHHPPVPGRSAPFVVALVELAEGVRMVGELIDADPALVRIGAPVRVAFVRVDDELTLPAWRLADLAPVPAAAAPAPVPAADPEPPGMALPELRIDVTPTFVVSTAIATRDFQDVHHDRDAAARRGSPDIFLNILASTGLVQRYVTDWAGERAAVRRIAIRLGVPAYPGDPLTMAGRAVPDGAGWVVEVVGRNSLGAHVTGTVRVDLPGGAG